MILTEDADCRERERERERANSLSIHSKREWFSRETRSRAETGRVEVWRITETNATYKKIELCLSYIIFNVCVGTASCKPWFWDFNVCLRSLRFSRNRFLVIQRSSSGRFLNSNNLPCIIAREVAWDSNDIHCENSEYWVLLNLNAL